MNIRHLGFVLLVIGIVLIMHAVFNFSIKENALELDYPQSKINKNHPIKWSPVVGLVVFLTGQYMVINGKRR